MPQVPQAVFRMLTVVAALPSQVEKKLMAMMSMKKVVAWGECGLDYFDKKTRRQAMVCHGYAMVSRGVQKPMCVVSTFRNLYQQ